MMADQLTDDCMTLSCSVTQNSNHFEASCGLDCLLIVGYCSFLGQRDQTNQKFI